MSSLDQSNLNDPASSSAPTHEPALERPTPDNMLAPPTSPSPASPPPSGDSSLYLQNAHYGAPDNETPSVAAAGKDGDAAGAPAPSQLDLTTKGETSPPAPQGSNDPDGPKGDAASGTDQSDAHPQKVDHRFVASETFSLKDGDHAAPAPQVQLLAANTGDGAPPLATATNEAPIAVTLSNTTVDENAAGAVIGTLTTIDPDVGDHFTYTVSDNRFEVVDGQLKLKDGIALDHEGEPSVTVSVTSTDSAGHSISATFAITVADVNETPSDIALSNATVAENAAGAVVGTLSTTDPDVGDTHTYTVSDDRFEIVGGQLKLKDGISLDHEAQPHVVVQVTSTDAGGLSRSESFMITVANVNEGPTDIALSNATVAENAAGAVVGTLSTSDPDAGDSHTYTLSDDRFEVVDGHLKLKDGISLDHEGEQSVTVQVTATDAGGLSVSENFTITVANVNEAPTDIGLSNATVPENAAGAVVGALSTVDPDASDTHAYTVSDDRFEVVDGHLKLKDGIALDHEGEPSVTVQVTSTDAGGLSVSENFTITVANVNEAPTGIGLSDTTVAENAAGAVIGALSTVDPDAGDTHTYTVSDDRFEVVDDHLKLKDGISLDHEGEPSVAVQVTVTDAGGLSVNENFTITVANVNEAPTDIALSNAIVAENAAGAVVGALSTVDPDAGDSHTYAVSDDRFEVVDGHLKLKDGISLDHEGDPSVTVQVTATDAGGLSVSENFTITVANVNEGPTDIALSNATIAENSAGAIVGTLSTGDPDISDSHTYIVSDDRFEIVSGQLKLKDGISLDHEGEPSVAVQVTATDAGGLSVNESFTITVANVNEAPTSIALSSATVAENAAGAVIGTLITTDPDAGDSHTYTVSDNRFEVIGGQLKLKSGVSLDYEAARSVSLNVTSTDIGGQSVTQSFTIAVTDVSEINIINGTPGNDTLNGTAGVDLINALAGNDTVSAGAGDDIIVGGKGNDTLDGGDGSDTFQTGAGDGFDKYADSGASGTDTIVATAGNVAIGVQSGFGPASGIEEISAGGFAGVSIQGNTSNDTLDFSNTTLSGITKIDGGAGNDTITGSAGADTIVGGAGNDTLKGGEGGDTYQVGVGAGFDSIVDTGTTGTDKVVATADNVVIGLQSGFGPASGIEEISAGGFANVWIQGNTSNDTLDFSATTLSGITKIDGGAGNDTITGSAGADTIVGGAGNDTLKGGDGGDTYQVGAGAGFDNIVDSGASGTDTIVATADNVAIGLQSGFGPASGIEEISAGGFANVSIQGNTSNDTLDFSATTLTGITKIDGGAGNDTITGSAGADTIVGGAGNDTLKGGDGGDTITGGTGADTLSGGAGSDTLSYAQSATGVTVDLANNVAAGGDAQGDKISGFENVTGSSFDDVIHGDTNNNVFDAGAGNDTIGFSLGAGHDTAFGGAGSDFIRIDTGGGSGGWLEAVADGSTPALTAGDWLLQLDTGQTYVLHGSGADFDFGGVHAGVLTAAGGSDMKFQEIEGLHW